MIHKETGLTFNQYKQKHSILDHNGFIRDKEKMFPVLLESGIPAVYVDQEYYPFLFFLNNKDWIIEKK